MKLGIIRLYMGESGKVGYYNIQELGLAKALIIPSLWYEGFPMIIPESLSLGVPIIASKIGNLKYIVKENIGYLFEPNNKEHLENIINLSFKDMENNNEIKKNV